MSVYQFVYSSVCLSISLFRQFVHLTFINPQSISLSIHLFLYSIHLSVYLPYSYQSIKSVCPLVSQSIYPSISLYVYLHSLCQSPSTQIILHISKIYNKLRGYVLWTSRWCISALMSRCSDAPMHQCTNSNFFSFKRYYFWQIFMVFSPIYEPPVITFCILIFFILNI